MLDSIFDPPPVAGNHARFAYDFSPASIVLRVTSAHSSRIQNCFEHAEEHRSYTITRLLQRIESGDIPASELIVGGEVSATSEGTRLKELKVQTYVGVREAVDTARQRIAACDAAFAILANHGRGIA